MRKSEFFHGYVSASSESSDSDLTISRVCLIKKTPGVAIFFY